MLLLGAAGSKQANCAKMLGQNHVAVKPSRKYILGLTKSMRKVSQAVGEKLRGPRRTHMEQQEITAPRTEYTNTTALATRNHLVKKNQIVFFYTQVMSNKNQIVLFYTQVMSNKNQIVFFLYTSDQQQKPNCFFLYTSDRQQKPNCFFIHK
jgi:hypothetical protein